MVHKSDKSPPPTSLSSFSLVLWVRNRAKPASGAPRPKSAPRGSKSSTFAQGKNSSLQPSKNGYESNRGTLRFTISISNILMAPSCSLRSFLEVSVSWAASRYSFRNLGFKHRGMQLGMWWYTIGINPTPNLLIKLQLGLMDNVTVFHTLMLAP